MPSRPRRRAGSDARHHSLCERPGAAHRPGTRGSHPTVRPGDAGAAPILRPAASAAGRGRRLRAPRRRCGPAEPPLPCINRMQIHLPCSTGTAYGSQLNRLLMPCPAGGYEYDGVAEIAPLDDAELRSALRDILELGIRSVVVSGVFSPVTADQEERAAAVLRSAAAQLLGGQGAAWLLRRPALPMRAGETWRSRLVHLCPPLPPPHRSRAAACLPESPDRQPGPDGKRECRHPECFPASAGAAGGAGRRGSHPAHRHRRSAILHWKRWHSHDCSRGNAGGGAVPWYYGRRSPPPVLPVPAASSRSSRHPLRPRSSQLIRSRVDL